jgi:hypothetical protein
MKQFVVTQFKRLIALTAVGMFLGCQSSDLDLYFVDHQEQANFLTLDIPKSVIAIDDADLTPRQLEAYNSVDKLNILMFKSDSSTVSQLDKEVATLNDIFKNSKYEELMKFGEQKEARVRLLINGDETALDEMVLYGHMSSRGFAVVRVLGDDMKLQDIMSLSSVIQQSDLSALNIDSIQDFFQ